ncbi:hypothetical protein [Aeromicrobium sp. UC242_57]|uniref:hypothetical protein n=1 Tax=Aeromicrobium sp. UC242_57 TaxID=3374624 RepID=UPI0037B318C6
MPVSVATEVTAAKKPPSAKAQRKQLLRVHRIAKKSSNYTSWRRITAKKNPRAVFYGVGKPTNKVRQAIRVARKKTGLKILWNSKARHTRSELRAAGKIVRRDKQVAFTGIFLPRGCLDIIFWDGDLSSLSPSELRSTTAWTSASEP